MLFVALIYNCLQENTKKSTHDLLKLIGDFSKVVGHKFNQQQLIHYYRRPVSSVG